MKRFTRFFVLLLVICSMCLFSGAKFDFDEIYSNEEVYLGGIPVGIEVGADGVIITGISSIKTTKGIVVPLENSNIKRGDVILSIAGLPVSTPHDVTEILEKTNINPIIITIKRGDEVFEEKVEFVIDENGNKKIGLFLRDNVTGIGTLTYITQDFRFGALGHHIKDNESGLKYELNKGILYNSMIYGVKKSSLNKAGELLGEIKSQEMTGNITKNNDFGIFGKFFGDMTGFKKIKVASQDEVKQGKAYINTTINGNCPEYFEIEILKCNNQSKANVKSMVLNIIDERLIGKTGGIVQGMSGSPIIQNGKLVGAVTHVFINDATKGYGIYIDWMLQN